MREHLQSYMFDSQINQRVFKTFLGSPFLVDQVSAFRKPHNWPAFEGVEIVPRQFWDNFVWEPNVLNTFCILDCFCRDINVWDTNVLTRKKIAMTVLFTVLLKPIPFRLPICDFQLQKKNNVILSQNVVRLNRKELF